MVDYHHKRDVRNYWVQRVAEKTLSGMQRHLFFLAVAMIHLGDEQDPGLDLFAERLQNIKRELLDHDAKYSKLLGLPQDEIDEVMKSRYCAKRFSIHRSLPQAPEYLDCLVILDIVCIKLDALADRGHIDIALRDERAYSHCRILYKYANRIMSQTGNLKKTLPRNNVSELSKSFYANPDDPKWKLTPRSIS